MSKLSSNTIMQGYFYTNDLYFSSFFSKQYSGVSNRIHFKMAAPMWQMFLLKFIVWLYWFIPFVTPEPCYKFTYKLASNTDMKDVVICQERYGSSSVRKKYVRTADDNLVALSHSDKLTSASNVFRVGLKLSKCTSMWYSRVSEEWGHSHESFILYNNMF